MYVAEIHEYMILDDTLVRLILSIVLEQASDLGSDLIVIHQIDRTDYGSAVLLDPAFHPVLAVGDVVMAARMLEQQFIDVDVCLGVQISS